MARMEVVLGIETTHSGGSGIEERRGEVDSGGVAISGVGVGQRRIGRTVRGRLGDGSVA